MHELSIAISITEIVKEEALKHQAEQVTMVHLRIGKLSGIEPDALYMAMEEAIRGTTLEKTNWVYNWIDGVAVCDECCQEFASNDYFKLCPHCNSINTALIKGKEMYVQSIEIE